LRGFQVKAQVIESENLSGQVGGLAPLFGVRLKFRRLKSPDFNYWNNWKT